VKATQALHERGQSLRLDNITRGMPDSGQIQHYIDNYAVTGLTSNPSVFMSRWGGAVAGHVPEDLTDRLGLAV
jgi:transaldolase